MDFIKIRTVASRETYLAIGEAARRAGLPLAGHPAAGPEDMLRAGQRSIEHASLGELALRPDSARQAVLAHLAEAGVVVVPTLVNGEKSLFLADSVQRALLADSAGRLDGRRRYVGPDLLAEWAEEVEDRARDRRDWAELAPALLRLQREARAAGVRMLPGSDVGVAFIYPGFSLHDELELMVRVLGMTPHEVLASATRRPAEFFGMRDSLGTIQPGKLADLVLLDRDPLQDIRITRAIRAVVANGRYLDRAALDALLEEAARER